MPAYYGVQRSQEYLKHYGIKGMRWRKKRASASMTYNNSEQINNAQYSPDGYNGQNVSGVYNIENMVNRQVQQFDSSGSGDSDRSAYRSLLGKVTNPKIMNLKQRAQRLLSIARRRR